MTWSNLKFNVSRSFVTMATNLPFCFFVQFLEQLLNFLANFTLLKYNSSQRSYGFLITKKRIFGFQNLDLKVHFSASFNKLRLRLYRAIYHSDSFALMLCYRANLKAIRYESTSLNRIVADKSPRVIVA